MKNPSPSLLAAFNTLPALEASVLSSTPALQPRGDELGLREALIEVLSLPTQTTVQAEVCRRLGAMGRPYVIDTYGNIISNPTPGVKKPFFVGHMDTVHRTHVDSMPLRIVRGGDWLMAIWNGPDGKGQLAQTGIGGDDKCGVWAALMAAEEEASGAGPAVGLIFPCDEEVGCLGTKHLIRTTPEALDDATCFIQLDRKGGGDAIASTNGINVWSPEWRRMLEGIMPTYGFKPCPGLYTDIGEYSRHTGRPSINVGSGYYAPHSDKETVNWVESINSLRFAFAIAAGAAAREEPWDALEVEVEKPSYKWPAQGYTRGYVSTFPGGPYGDNTWGVYSDREAYVFIHQFKGWCSIYGSIYERWRILFPAAILDRKGDGCVATDALTVVQAEEYLAGLEFSKGREAYAYITKSQATKTGKAKKDRKHKGPSETPFKKREPETIAGKLRRTVAVQLQYPECDVKVEVSPEGLAVYENPEAEVVYDWPEAGGFDATGIATDDEARRAAGATRVTNARAFRISVVGVGGEWYVVSGLVSEWDSITNAVELTEYAASCTDLFLDNARYPVFTSLTTPLTGAEPNYEALPALTVEVTKVESAPCWRGTYDAKLRGYLSPAQFESLGHPEAVVITSDTVIFAEAFAADYPGVYASAKVVPAVADEEYKRAIGELQVLLADALPKHTLNSLT